MDFAADVQAFAERFGSPPGMRAALLELLVRLRAGGALAPAEADVAHLVESDEPPNPNPNASASASELPTDETAPHAATGTLPSRYADLGVIGTGGMGKVHRVRDRELGRVVALKIITQPLVGRPELVARFVEEAQVAAQLQHPGLVPVYDAGRLPDGRTWFTMKEVKGRTLADAIAEVHAASADGTWRTGATGWTLHRLVDAFAKAAAAVGYAHARGVLHRDLKPENVMVGDHGEVLVLDWGLAKVLAGPGVGRLERLGVDVLDELVAPIGDHGREATVVGTVSGTVAYMAPEQARGQIDRLDPRTDVYGLGAILYEILSGRPPYEGRSAGQVLQLVRAGPPEPPGLAWGGAGSAGSTISVLRGSWTGEEGQVLPLPRECEVVASGAPVPAELLALWERAMAREMGDRFANGSEVAAEARAWLEGARRREQALLVVEEASAADGEAAGLRERAAVLRTEGAALLEGVKTWEPEERKAAGWAKQDAAAALERDAGLAEVRAEQRLHGALQHDPGLVEAHALLTERARAAHAAAEDRRDPDRAVRAEVPLRVHADSLPEGHPVRVACATYLKGDGALTLVTDPDGAEVELFRYETRNRRLVPVRVRTLGRTPLVEVSLPMGSYLCVVRHPERAEVRYPVVVGRGEHWDGVRPGDRGPSPVRLPLRGELGPDDCLVPAGWSWSGGDDEAYGSLPRRRLWCDELVVRRFPVTNREYLAFLDDLVATGREADALRHQPRERAAGGDGSPVYGRDEAGRFVLRPDADGDVWAPDWPVFLVAWHGASAYAAWLAGRAGRPWRLLGELEWEKAARGVDGRFQPWGDGFDPSWCCMTSSHPGRRLPQAVDSFPVDESVYGVRGLSGNVQDWCADAWEAGGPRLEGDRVMSPDRQGVAELDDAGPVRPRGHGRPALPDARVHRGGYWFGTARFARSANRSRSGPGDRDVDLGLRVAFRPGPAPQHG